MLIYQYQSEFLCEKCGIARQLELDDSPHGHPDFIPDFYQNQNTYPQGPFESSELRLHRPHHCSSGNFNDKDCGLFLENGLSEFGIEWIIEEVEDWPEFCLECNYDLATIRFNEKDLHLWCQFYEIPFTTLKMAREMEELHIKQQARLRKE